MPACSVTGCGKSSKTSNLQKDGITFHLFPRDLTQRKIWAEVCNKAVDWFPKNSSSICSRHFHKSQFRQNTLNNRRVLLKNAVPSLLLTRQELAKVNPKNATRRFPKVIKSSPSGSCKIRSKQPKKIVPESLRSASDSDVKLENEAMKNLQTYVKELLPDIDDSNSVYVIIVNKEDDKKDSDDEWLSSKDNRIEISLKERYDSEAINEIKRPRKTITGKSLMKKLTK